MSEFFHNLHQYTPRPGDSQYTSISMIGGNISPTILKLTAPTRVKKGLKFGNIAATTTKTKKIICTLIHIAVNNNFKQNCINK